MAEWSKNRVDSSSINGGREFTTDDDLAVNELNAIVNNSFYGVDFAEAMADAPDISEIDGIGTPSVSLVSNVKNGRPFKKFKFSNLKGEKGDKGAKIASQVLQGQDANGGNVYLQTFEDGTTTTFTAPKGDKGDAVPNTLTIGNVSSGDTASASVTGTAPNQVLNLVLPKGEKGDDGNISNARVLKISGNFPSLYVSDNVIVFKLSDDGVPAWIEANKKYEVIGRYATQRFILQFYTNENSYVNGYASSICRMVAYCTDTYPGRFLASVSDAGNYNLSISLFFGLDEHANTGANNSDTKNTGSIEAIYEVIV